MNACRRSIYTLVYIVYILCGGAGADATAAAATVLRTAAQAQSEPKFVEAGEAGRHAVGGLCVELFRALEKTDGELRFTGDQGWSPPARIDAGMQSGALDVACGLVRTTRRAARATALLPALFTLHYVLLARAGDAAAVASLDDVAHLAGDNVVLSMQGSGPSQQLQEMTALPVDAGTSTVRQNLDKLLMGRGRFFYYRLPGLNPVIREYCGKHQIKVLPAVMRNEPVYLMLARHVPPAAAQRLQAALRKLKDSGELDQLLRKWKVIGNSTESC